MPAVLLSNPGGLPLAVLGNPGKRKLHMARRRSRRSRLTKAEKAWKRANRESLRRNPTYEFATRSPGGAIKSGTHRTSGRAHLDSFLGRQFPGYEVVSVRSLGGGKRKRKSKSKRKASRPRRSTSKKHRGKRSHRKASAMAKTRRRSRRRSRSSRVVGRTYRRKGRGFVRVSNRYVRSRRGKRSRHPAVSWSGRKGKVVYSGTGNRRGKRRHKIHAIRFTNPKRRRSRRRGRARRNPGAIGAYVGGLTSAPGKVLGMFKGKNMVKNALFLGGGTVATYLIGGIVMKFASPLLAKIPGASGVLANPMVQRVVGATMPYTAAFIATKLFRKQIGAYAGPIMLGGAVASLIELLMPGKVHQLIAMIPGASSLPGFNGMSGPTDALAGFFGTELAGYVSAPSYAGVGNEQLAGYVSAPSYAGVGEATQLAGYVSAPSYAGVGGFLDEASDNALTSFIQDQEPVFSNN